MGGRTKRKLPERETWITEVSNSRLERYSAMLQSGGAVQRIDGSVRTLGQQDYFGDLVSREIARRKNS